MPIITAATAEHNKNTGAVVPKQANMNDATSQKETIAITQRVSRGIFLQVLCGAAGKPHLTHSVSVRPQNSRRKNLAHSLFWSVSGKLSLSILNFFWNNGYLPEVEWYFLSLVSKGDMSACLGSKPWEVRMPELILNPLAHPLNGSGSHESFESHESVLLWNCAGNESTPTSRYKT